MFNIRNNRKSLFIALYLYLFIYTAYLTTTCIMGHNLFSFFDIEWFLIPIERWLMTVIPALILVKVFERELYINLKDMFTNKVKLKIFLWCFLPVLLYWVGGLILAKYFGIAFGSKSSREFSSIKELTFTFTENGCYALTVAAIPEEMLHRAWTLNAFMGKTPTKNQEIKAIIMSSILFVLTHFPSYIFVYQYSMPQILSNLITIFVIGYIFGTIFLKSKNIVLPIFIHCLWDTFMLTF